ncbi:Uma2 family endonuclease [Streptomyces sp. NPDC017673]|uniref:Uma2 family endonuclease n=1 Tax=unclassified Streptomyces TaxID=2593676 RepID=UPI0037A4AC59
MTVTAERTSSQLSVDTFERIADFAEREDETVRFEFIDGRIGLKKVTNGNHNAITMRLIRQCMRARPELDLNPGAQAHTKRGPDSGPLFVCACAPYAEAGIPVYLLIDRDNLSIPVHSDPDIEVGHRDIHVVRPGAKVTLPDPVGIGLDTGELKQYVD